MAEHVCPVWIGYILASPLRKLCQNPTRILRPHVAEGMTVLDIGCAMGFFSLPMARLVGPAGKVLCVDLQQKMIQILERRARKAGLMDRVETHLCVADSLGLHSMNGQIDFALAFAVIHEVPSAQSTFSEIYESLKPARRLLVAEPNGRVSEEEFEATISIAEQVGFKIIKRPSVRRSRAVLLAKSP